MFSAAEAVLLAFEGEVGHRAALARSASAIISDWLGGTTLSSSP